MMPWFGAEPQSVVAEVLCFYFQAPLFRRWGAKRLMFACFAFGVVRFALIGAGAQSLALLVFGVAAITDYFDGQIARARGIVTNFGKLFDPLADKIFTCSAFIAFVEIKQMAAWMVICILSDVLRANFAV